MARVIVENAAVPGKSLPPPTDVSWGVPPIVWDGYPNPVDADARAGTAAAATSHPIPYPTNMQIGELVVVLLTDEGSGPLGLPAAFTSIGGGSWGRVCYRRWLGGEGATFIVTTGTARRVIYHVYRIQDAHPTTPPEAKNTTGAVSANPSVLPGGTVLDPAGWGTEKTLWLASIGVANASVITGYPTGYPFGHSQRFAGTNSQCDAYARAEQNLNPTGVWSGITSTQMSRFVVAVRPRPA